MVGNAIEPVFTPDGPAAEGDYVLAVGDARAAQEPRAGPPRRPRGPASSCGSSARAGWGGVETPGWVGEVSDEELAALYRGARCLVFPSLYEGFGIPVLEAMACGTPVVTSRGGATEEVAGGAAVLVDPLDVEAIAAGIEEATCAARRAARRSGSSGHGSSRGRGRRRVEARLAGARVTAARRRRRRRARPRAHGRRDVRAQPAPRAGAARAGGRPADRGRDAPTPTSSRTGSRPSSSDTSVPGAADGLTLPRLLRRARRRARPLPVRAAARAALPGGRHDPRPLLRARALADEPQGPARLPAGRAARGAEGPARVLTVSERTRRDLRELYDVPDGKIVVTPNGVDPAFTPGDGRARLRPARRRRPGAEEPARGARRSDGGRAAARRRRAGQGRGARPRARAARRPRHRLRRPGGARPPLSRRRLPRAAVALRGVRAAGARGDGERDARRRCAGACTPGGRRRGRRLGRGARARGRHPPRARRA